MEASKKGYLSCQKCESNWPLQNLNSCPICQGILVVAYSKEYLKQVEVTKPDTNHKGIWQYANILPFVKAENQMTLSEGMTPIHKVDKTLCFKDEGKNPTGSFKDRGIAVSIAMAKELGCKRVVIASSGNGGASAAAYASKAGLESTILIPEATPITKVAQAIAYGGKVTKVGGHFSNAYNEAKRRASEKETMNITTTFLMPYVLEGYKTIAYEVVEQLEQLPDYICIPVGDGPILYGIYKGFMELYQRGNITHIPKLVAVQAKGCAPIVEAYEGKHRVRACQRPRSIASAICDPLIGYEQDGELTLQAIEATKGIAISVSDEEILEAGKWLAEEASLFVEPSSAAAYAGWKKLKDKGVIQEETGLCVLTGSGLKDPTAYLDTPIDVPIIYS